MQSYSIGPEMKGPGMTKGSPFLNHHCTLDCHHKLVKLSYKEWSLL